MGLRVIGSLSAEVQARLLAGGQGLLIGYFPDSSNVCILDALHLATEPKSEAGAVLTDGALADAVTHLLPRGLSHVGVYAPDRTAAAALLGMPLVKDMLAAAATSTSLPAGNIVVACTQAGSLLYSLHSSVASSWSDVQVRSQEGKLRTEAGGWWGEQPPTLCSVSMSVPLDVWAPTSGSATSDAQAIMVAGSQLETSLDSSSRMMLVQNRAGKKQVLSSGSTGTVQSLTGNASSTCSLDTVLLAAQPLKTQENSTSDIGRAPVYQYQVPAVGPLSHRQARLHLHVLAYVPQGVAASDLGPKWLLPALTQQIRAACSLLARSKTAGQLPDVRAYHFLPPGRSHHVTLLYPEPRVGNADAVEAGLAPLRRALHQVLGLPTNRPMLRMANARSLQLSASEQAAAAGAATAGTGRLRDVHIGLNNPVPGGTVSLIDGHYDYYHYMQDRFNDNGWGCAYRSLQTLVSWFQLQQYTSKAVPSHKEVQQLLVRLGDKPPEFVGSSNWIGAIELSYILDEYLGVTSKIITVNRGADIPSKARELAAHFTTQGTPVMIGGGVLAYTLLGVSFNELTGDCAFLILDPHYTGGEDLRKIQSGTWVCWKKPGDNAAAGGPLFVQDAFYNFLCPQRPQAI